MGKPSAPAEELTTLGRIGAAHGIKGWVRLISFTDPADNILQFSQFYPSPGGVSGSQVVSTNLEQIEPDQIEIDESRAQGKHFVAHIKGCDSPEETRIYTGRELQVARSELPELASEEFYWFELEGLKVINAQEEDLGVVHHLIGTGANDVLVVRATESSIDNEERLIPFIRESVVKNVDLKGKILRVDWEKDY